MRMFQDCIGCCLTWLLVTMIMIGLTIYLALPLVTTAIEQLATQGAPS